MLNCTISTKYPGLGDSLQKVVMVVFLPADSQGMVAWKPKRNELEDLIHDKIPSPSSWELGSSHVFYTSILFPTSRHHATTLYLKSTKINVCICILYKRLNIIIKRNNYNCLFKKCTSHMTPSLWNTSMIYGWWTGKRTIHTSHLLRNT